MQVYRFRVVALLIALGAASCAQNNGPSYNDELASRPDPTTPAERQEECAWVRGEIARQENLAQMAGSMGMAPMMAMASQAAARNHIAALESRAADIQCNAAFSSAPAESMPAPASSTFDQCFAHCQAVTDRTKDQCFDSCKNN
jgi:hypothetical protein